MNRFKQSFSRFMYGRYGMDQLSRCLSYVVLVLIILTFFLRSNVIYTVYISECFQEIYQEEVLKIRSI